MIVAPNISEYTQGMTYDNFVSDRKTTDAVIRNFEVLGEASKRIPEEVGLQIIGLNGER